MCVCAPATTLSAFVITLPHCTSTDVFVLVGWLAVLCTRTQVQSYICAVRVCVHSDTCVSVVFFSISCTATHDISAMSNTKIYVAAAAAVAIDVLRIWYMYICILRVTYERKFNWTDELNRQIEFMGQHSTYMLLLAHLI